jgi:hypothetical protein
VNIENTPNNFYQVFQVEDEDRHKYNNNHRMKEYIIRLGTVCDDRIT